MFYCLKKVFPAHNYDDEIVGYFNDYDKALLCKIEGPRYSIDDPNIFFIEITIVTVIPESWTLEMNESIWGKF